MRIMPNPTDSVMRHGRQYTNMFLPWLMESVISGITKTGLKHLALQ